MSDSKPANDAPGSVGSPAPRVLVIWNPNAGSKAGLPTNRAGEADLVRALDAHGVRHDLFRSNSAEAARSRIDAALDEGIEVIAAAGGDGTAHAIARRLLSRDGAARAEASSSSTALGLLPLGSAMNLAKAVGIPRDLDEAAAILASNQVRPIDVGFIGDRPFFEIVSIGLSAEAFEHAQAVDRERRWGAILEFLRLAARYRRTRIRLELDGRVRRTRALALAIANGPDTGMNVRLAEAARIDDGLLDVVAYEGLGPAGLVAHLVRSAFRRDRRSTFRTERAARIVVQTHRALAVRADAGDAGTTPVTITVRPGALRVVAPPPETSEQA